VGQSYYLDDVYGVTKHRPLKSRVTSNAADTVLSYLYREDEASTKSDVVAALRAAWASQDILVPAAPALSEQVIRALSYTEFDWRTPASLAEELGVSELQVRQELQELGSKVRRPLTSSDKYADWYRLSSKGLTRKEKWLRIKAVFTASPLGDF